MNSKFYALINVKTEGIDERSAMGDFKSVIRHITVNIFEVKSKNIIDSFQSDVLNEYVHSIDEESAYKKELMYDSLSLHSIMKCLDLFLSVYENMTLVFLYWYDRDAFIPIFPTFRLELFKYENYIITELISEEKSASIQNLEDGHIHCMDYNQKISLLKEYSSLIG